MGYLCPYSSTPRAIRAFSISIAVGSNAFGIGKLGHCHALCSTVLITCGGATSRRTMPQWEKSNARAFSLLYSISTNNSLSSLVSPVPTFSLEILSSVSLDPRSISENLGISHFEYLPVGSLYTSDLFEISTQFITPPGLSPSDFPQSTGLTLSAFLLYIVNTLNSRGRSEERR